MWNCVCPLTVADPWIAAHVRAIQIGANETQMQCIWTLLQAATNKTRTRVFTDITNDSVFCILFYFVKGLCCCNKEQKLERSWRLMSTQAGNSVVCVHVTLMSCCYLGAAEKCCVSEARSPSASTCLCSVLMIFLLFSVEQPEKQEREHLVKFPGHAHVNNSTGFNLHSFTLMGNLGFLIALIMIQQRAPHRPALSLRKCCWCS